MLIGIVSVYEEHVSSHSTGFVWFLIFARGRIGMDFLDGIFLLPSGLMQMTLKKKVCVTREQNTRKELAFLALIFIFALVIWILGRNGNTSTAKKTKKEEKGTGKGKLSKQVRKEADGECFYWHF